VRYRETRPSAQLQPFIESCWILEHDGSDGAPQRVVPDGHPELILNLEQPFEFFQGGEWHLQPRCFFAGQIDGPLLLRPTGPSKILGFRFRPYGAAMLFGVPMPELSRRFTPLEDLSRTLARNLDRALDSADPLARVETALGAGESSRFADPVVSEVVRRMIAGRGAVNVSALAREVGLSVRQFERRFHASVGLPPKLFCRTQRFTHVFHAIGTGSNWADAAVECGYFDQAHLIRDFKELSGQTPAALLADDADLARHFLSRFGVSHSYKTARQHSI